MDATGTGGDEDLTLARSNYLFLLPPLLIFALGAFLHYTFSNPNLSVDTIVQQTGQAPLQKEKLLATGALYRFVAALFAFFVAAIATIAVLVFDLKRRLPRRRTIEILCLLIVPFLPIFYYAVVSQTQDRSSNYYYWGRTVFEALSELITPGRCLSWNASGADGFSLSNAALCTKSAFLEHYVLITKFGNSLSILASLAAIMGMVLSKARITGTTQRPADAEAILKQYLYIGAFLLSLATVIYGSVGTLGATVVTPEIQKAYIDMANGLTVFWGIVFSTVLATAYASVAFFSSPSKAESESVDQAGATHQRSVPDIIATLSAILSPILTGILGSQLGILA